MALEKTQRVFIGLLISSLHNLLEMMNDLFDFALNFNLLRIELFQLLLNILIRVKVLMRLDVVNFGIFSDQ